MEGIYTYMKRESPLNKRGLTPSTNPFSGTDPESLMISFVNHLEYSLGKDEYSATKRDLFKSLALTVRDRLFERWIETQQEYYHKAVKRIYYLSLEFLIGRTLTNALINLGLYENAAQSMRKLGVEIEELQEIEFEAGLGNGGLGRLAACLLDSMATLGLPAYGYGIRYEYGIFFQRIKHGYQIETPDNWLRYGNPWEIERPEHLYPVKFYGRVKQYIDGHGDFRCNWIDTQNVMAMAFDTPVPGYRNNTVNNLRLWAAKSTREFNLDYFNHGDYERAVSDKAHSETISMVLYPNDNVFEGRELRLKQEYFFVSATLQDIIRRYKKTHPESFKKFPDEVAIQLNDTHPSIAIPELMRLLVDKEGVCWNVAWDITVRTFGYTNHTIQPEALEKWPVSMMENVLPRHVQIIYEINRRFLDRLKKLYPASYNEKARELSIFEEAAEKSVRMSHLAIIGSHSINGVSELHTKLIKNDIFKDFYEICPKRFNNKTNGISQRRWMKTCNPDLAELVSKHIGEGWISDLTELKKLIPLASDDEFQKSWRDIKRRNKKKLAEYIKQRNKTTIHTTSLFDCQIKRMHEYKRQLLNVLHIIHLYNIIKERGSSYIVPRTFIFAGKAAPGYFITKLIIKLINSIADLINFDWEIKDKIKVVFLANYNVSLAEKIIPAADLSEQISTAGNEASGTGNMKFALNGALTIGTLDGANIEIKQEVGKENIFTFGLTSEGIRDLRNSGYNPWEYYNQDVRIKKIIDRIANGHFSPSEPNLFEPIIDTVMNGGDQYMLLADFAAYVACQERVSKAYKNKNKWTRMSILNVANMGKFSSDRTVREYAQEIWELQPVHIEIPPSSNSLGETK
jgi:starch phosphorylase